MQTAPDSWGSEEVDPAPGPQEAQTAPRPQCGPLTSRTVQSSFFFFFLKPVDAFFVTAAGESSYALSQVATHNLQTTC